MRHITDTSTDAPKMGSDGRVVAIVLGLVGAACLIVASLSKSWMANDNFSGYVRDSDGKASLEQGRYLRFQGDIRFGPLGFERCAKPYRGFEMHETPAEITCEEMSTSERNFQIGVAAGLDRDRYTSGAFALAGRIAFVACLVAAAGLVAAAAMALARNQKELPVSPASVALLGILGGLLAGC